MFRALLSAKNYVQNAVRRLFKREEGATVVEYAILVGLLSIVAIVVIASVGTEVKETFQVVDTALDTNAAVAPTP